MSKVAFIKSDNRAYNIERALSLIKSEIISGLKGARSVVVKPNCVSDSVKLAATHQEALRAVLEFITPYIEHQITLAEGSGIGETLNAFRNFGYLALQEQYDFAICDLNSDDFETIPLLDRRGRTWQAHFAKTLLEADYLISVSPPKTHNEVVYTGAVKNVSVGGLIRRGGTFSHLRRKDHKAAIHQGLKIINENIKRIFECIPLKLAVLDGFEAMEGDGPIEGDMVPAHFAIASSDALAADWLACQLMNITLSDVGYLSLLGADSGEHFIIGDPWRDKIIKFKMHRDFEKNRKWR